MASPKYCSWDVKELASDYGWTELPADPKDEGGVMSFYSDRHGGVTVNVFVRSGKVTTSLEHPTKGETQLYKGQRNTFDELEDMFDNPYMHAGSGYKTRAKLREEEEVDEGVTEASTNHLNEVLGDIENLRIEGNASHKISNAGAGVINLQRQEMRESMSEFDGELEIEKLLSKWDEEENDSSEEETSFSDDHDQLEDSEYSNSSEESEQDINDSTNTNEEDTSEFEDNDTRQGNLDSNFYLSGNSDETDSESEGMESESGGNEFTGESGEDNDDDDDNADF